MTISGSMSLHTPEGLQEMEVVSLATFKMSENRARQFYNHTDILCIYPDI